MRAGPHNITPLDADGVPNTGGGGGGTGGWNYPGRGGSGVVILKWTPTV
jgi:hypothetical protein